MSHKQERRKQIFTKVSLKSLPIKVNLCQVQKLWKETRKIEETKNQFMRITLLKTVTISSCNLFRIYEAQQKAQQEMEMENKEDEMNSFLLLLRRVFITLCSSLCIWSTISQSCLLTLRRGRTLRAHQTEPDWFKLKLQLEVVKRQRVKGSVSVRKRGRLFHFFCCYALLIIFSQILMRIQSANEFYKTYVWKGSVWIV